MSKEYGSLTEKQTLRLRFPTDIDTMRYELRNYARGSVVSGVARLFPEQLDALMQSSRSAAGEIFETGLGSAEYFVPTGEEGVFERGHGLRWPPDRQPNPVLGYLAGVDEIVVPVGLRDERSGRLCVAVEPLSSRPNPGIFHNFDDHGWLDQWWQPVGVTEHLDKRIWLPVDAITPDVTRLVEPVELETTATL